MLPILLFLDMSYTSDHLTTADRVCWTQIAAVSVSRAVGQSTILQNEDYGSYLDCT